MMTSIERLRGALVTEREISDKLEKALTRLFDEGMKNAMLSEGWPEQVAAVGNAEATLAEVAALRNKEINDDGVSLLR